MRSWPGATHLFSAARRSRWAVGCVPRQQGGAWSSGALAACRLPWVAPCRSHGEGGAGAGGGQHIELGVALLGALALGALQPRQGGGRGHRRRVRGGGAACRMPAGVPASAGAWHWRADQARPVAACPARCADLSKVAVALGAARQGGVALLAGQGAGGGVAGQAKALHAGQGDGGHVGAAEGRVGGSACDALASVSTGEANLRQSTGGRKAVSACPGHGRPRAGAGWRGNIWPAGLPSARHRQQPAEPRAHMHALPGTCRSGSRCHERPPGSRRGCPAGSAGVGVRRGRGMVACRRRRRPSAGGSKHGLACSPHACRCRWGALGC